MFIKQAAAALAITLGTITTAYAGPIYTYNNDDPRGNHRAGQVTEIEAAYNTNNEMLTWSYDINDVNGTQASDSFWVVITPGPNPKKHMDEFVIFYGDLDNGIVTSHIYSGQNNANSYRTANSYLQTDALSVVDHGDSQTVSFTIDASNINALNLPGWVGASFGVDDGDAVGSEIGIWFHPAQNSSFTYNNDGSIQNYSHGAQGWYDYHRHDAEVPEPSTTLLLSGGLLGFAAFTRRRRQRS